MAAARACSIIAGESPGLGWIDMSVDVTNPLEPGTAQELFVAPSTFTHNAILADSSGSRFLIPMPAGEQNTAQIQVLFNGLEELDQSDNR